MGDFWTKLPTFNPPIIINVRVIFRIRLQLQNGIAAVFKENDTKSSLTIKADFIIREPASTRE